MNDKSNTKLQSLKLLWDEFSDYKYSMGILLILMWIKSLLDAILPLVLIPAFVVIGVENIGDNNSNQLQYLFQFFETVQNYLGFSDVIVTTIFIACAIAVPKVIVTIMFEYLQNNIIYSYEHKCRSELFSHLLGVNWAFYLHQNSGNLINTLHTETNRAGRVFTGLVVLLDTLMLITFYLLIAMYISWEATLFAFGAFSILFFIIVPAARRSKLYGQKAVYSREMLMHHINQLIHSFKILKGSRMEGAAQKFIADASDRCRFFYVRMGIIKILPGTLFEPIIIFAILGLIYSAKNYTFISLAQAGTVAIILYRCLNKSVNVHKFWLAFYEFMPSLRLMNSLPILFQQNKEDRPSGTLDTIRSMQFEDFTFQYPTGKVPALLNINLEIKQGDYIGIVGTSGSGKTTLVDSLLYLLKPTSGKISVNDTDLRDIDPWNWRESIGYVPQESIMFNDTIRNNIAIYRPNISDDDIKWAAKIANVDEFIEELPDKYETIVGERGSRISGGQRQRMALARALVNKPQILLLDEATSALDTFTENKIHESVDRLKGQFTIVVIAHRLSTLLNADRIIVLEDGGIVQTGTPVSLIEKQGSFQEMYKQQFHGAAGDSTESVPNPA